MKILARLALVPAVLAGVGLGASPASAEVGDGYSQQEFAVCYKNSDCNMGFTSGAISWPVACQLGHTCYVAVEGRVVNRLGSSYSTTAVFEAFDHSGIKLQGDTRTVADGNKNFTFIGFPEATARVKITVCQNWADGTRTCGSPESYSGM
ncbi:MULTISPECIES: hypothetical protein [unclassified Streptomyces]|uniref:hypothetical protein n=1 Tax=unclassified Streptomyces TaxID=2593676 RepID=UPI003676F398